MNYVGSWADTKMRGDVDVDVDEAEEGQRERDAGTDRRAACVDMR